jgi:hypothetical protein
MIAEPVYTISRKTSNNRLNANFVSSIKKEKTSNTVTLTACSKLIKQRLNRGFVRSTIGSKNTEKESMMEVVINTSDNSIGEENCSLNLHTINMYNMLSHKFNIIPISVIFLNDI